MGAFLAICGVYGYPWGRTRLSMGRTVIDGTLRISMGWYKAISGPYGFPWGLTILFVGQTDSRDRTLLSVGRTAIHVLVLGNIHANGFLWERNKLSVGEKYNFWAERIPVGISPIFRFMKDLDIPTSYFGKLLFRVFCLIAFLIKKLNIYISIELNRSHRVYTLAAA